jgi:formylglycine-generating enzyme required for sulfatase activity
MIVIPGPVEFRMGSPPEEEGHTSWEPQHRRRIDRNFALASTSVTVAQFQRFLKVDPLRQKQFEADGATEPMNIYAPAPDCPIITVDWFMAAAYCNWLSEREGIPRDQWCYTTNSTGQLMKKAGY